MKQLIVNHKANLNYEEILEYESSIRNLDLIIMPSLCYLSIFQQGQYKLGSQDISEFVETNVTGEVNGVQLKSLNVKYVLIGHSDFRNKKQQSKESMLKKINNAIINNIIPIYCIGNNEFSNINDLKDEINEILTKYKDRKIIIAYEPVKNIGSKIIDFENIKNIIIELKEEILKLSNNTTLFYGGGLNVNNLDDVLSIKELDGILISSDSLDIKNVLDIYNKLK